jgi:hypothetical protein
MVTVTGLDAAAWRVAPHSAFLGQKDDLMRVTDAITPVSEGQGHHRCYSLSKLSCLSFLRVAEK